MLIEVFRYPDEAERRANAGHFGAKAPRESIPSLGHHWGTSRTTVLISRLRDSENRTLS